MGGHAKKPASKVDSVPAAAVVSRKKATMPGKRDSDEIIEKEVDSSKKQKIDNGGVAQAVEKKVVRKAVRKNVKKEESGLLEPIEEPKKEKTKSNGAATSQQELAGVTKNDDVDTMKGDSRDKAGSDNEIKVTPTKKPAADAANAVPMTDEEIKVTPTEKPVADAANPVPMTEEENHDFEEGSIEEPSKPQAVEIKVTHTEKPATDAANPVLMTEEEENNDSEEGSDEEPSKPQAVEEVGEAQAEEKASGSEEESDESDGDTDVEMDDAPSENKAPETPKTQATASRTLFMGNLSYSIKEKHVVNFFKDAGVVIKVRFAMRDGRFAGYGHVEFATPEAAQKGLELHGQELLGREVRLDLAKERVARTLGGSDRPLQKNPSKPQGEEVGGAQAEEKASGSEEESDESDGDTDADMDDAPSEKKALETPKTRATASRTLYMGNLSFSIKEKNIVDFFKDVGEVVEVRIAMRNGMLAGYGHVDFATPEAAQKGLELHGQELLGREVRLEIAKERDAQTLGGSERPFQKKPSKLQGEEVGGAQAENKASGSAEESDESDGDTDVHMDDALSEKKAPGTQKTQATATRILYMGNLSYSIKEKNVVDFFKDAGVVVKVRFAMRDGRFVGYGHVEFATPEAAQKGLQLHGQELLGREVRLYLAKERGAQTLGGSEMPCQKKLSKAQGEEVGGAQAEEKASGSEEESDESDGDTDVDMDDARSEKKAPGTPRTQATASRTLFMGNLSFSIKEKNVVDFFKDAGVVVEVRFAMRDGRFVGYGHVEFDTPEAAQKGLELHGQELLGREVRLDLAKERGAQTPGGSERPFQKKPSKPQGEEVGGAQAEEKASGSLEESDESDGDTDVDMDDAPSEKKALETPKTRAAASRTLYMGNLSFSIKEENVVDFFKDAGVVVEVRFAMKDGRFVGYGHVDFATREAAQKGLELNGQELLGREVRLDLAKERGAQTPGGRSFQKKPRGEEVGGSQPEEKAGCSQEKSDETDGDMDDAPSEKKTELALHGQELLGCEARLDLAKERGAETPGGSGRLFQKKTQIKTIFVEGINTDEDFRTMKSALLEHFGKCGEVTRVSIPLDSESGALKGVAFIDFAEEDGFHKAMELSGSDVGGRSITVKEGKPKHDSQGRGRGRGGGRRGSGRR